VFVGDDPAIADLAKAGGVADQHVQYSAVGEGAAEPLQTMAEGDLVVGCDMQVAQFTFYVNFSRMVLACPER
jgi:hypothetical protein